MNRCKSMLLVRTLATSLCWGGLASAPCWAQHAASGVVVQGQSPDGAYPGQLSEQARQRLADRYAPVAPAAMPTKPHPVTLPAPVATPSAQGGKGAAKKATSPSAAKPSKAAKPKAAASGKKMPATPVPRRGRAQDKPPAKHPAKQVGKHPAQPASPRPHKKAV